MAYFFYFWNISHLITQFIRSQMSVERDKYLEELVYQKSWLFKISYFHLHLFISTLNSTWYTSLGASYLQTSESASLDAERQKHHLCHEVPALLLGALHHNFAQEIGWSFDLII